MDAIDKAATKFGMPMGPIALTDMVGLETAVLCRQGAGRRPIPTGRRPRRSWTRWSRPGRPARSPVLGSGVSEGKTVEAAARPGGRGDPRQAPDRRPNAMDEEEITDRLFLPMLLEATRVLEEGIVREPADVDMGLILGIGFPPFRGGILRWCDTEGAAAIVERLAKYAPLGKRSSRPRCSLGWPQTGETFYPRPKLRGGDRP